MKRNGSYVIVIIVVTLSVWGIIPALSAWAIDVNTGFAYDESFSMGTSAIAALPTDWRVDKQTTARTLGTWAAASSATEQRAGNNMGTSATNGIYNYAAGDPATAIERAIGWVSSGSAGAMKSGNLYVHLTNATANTLGSIRISYDVEKYRNGSNAAGFSIQLYYSTNGTTWTSAGSNYLTSFPADADSNGFASAPGTTVSIVNQTLSIPSGIAQSGDLYLAWNYSVTTGSTTTNAQGLGVDNIHIDTPLTPSAVTLNDLTANSTATSLPAPIALGVLGLTATALLLRRRAARTTSK